MEIKIDTNRDSKEDIKKAIKLLKSYIESYSDTDDYDAPAEGSFNIFGDDEDTTIDEGNSNDSSDDNVEIMPYDI